MSHSFVFCTLCFWRLVVFCGAMKTVSIMEGDSVTLLNNFTEIQKDDIIMWKFGDQKSQIAEINAAAEIFKTHDGPDGRFRGRLKLDHQTGSLTITNTRTTDSGLYLITFGRTIEKIYRYNVTVYGITRVNPVLISTAASGSLLIVAVLGIFCICKRLRKTAEEVQTHKEEVIYADPTHRKQNSHKMRFKEKDEVVYAGVTMSC